MNGNTNVTNKPADARGEDAMLPAVDVIEDGAGITLYADLPGVPKDALDIRVESETLTIAGEVRLDLPEGMQATHVELGRPRFRRVFTLSKELDPNRVDAQFAHGVLTLRIPKAEHARPRKVEIKVT